MPKDKGIIRFGRFVAADDSPLEILAWGYCMDWDADELSEASVALKILGTMNRDQKTRLHDAISALLRANPEDTALTAAWLKLGAEGWLKRTSVRSFLENMRLELERTTA